MAAKIGEKSGNVVSGFEDIWHNSRRPKVNKTRKMADVSSSRKSGGPKNQQPNHKTIYTAENYMYQSKRGANIEGCC
jgi:hypothetical protein